MPTSIPGSAREVAKTRANRIRHLGPRESRETCESLPETLKGLVLLGVSSQGDIDLLLVQLHPLKSPCNEVVQAFRR